MVTLNSDEHAHLSRDEHDKCPSRTSRKRSWKGLQVRLGPDRASPLAVSSPSGEKDLSALLSIAGQVDMAILMDMVTDLEPV